MRVLQHILLTLCVDFQIYTITFAGCHNALPSFDSARQLTGNIHPRTRCDTAMAHECGGQSQYGIIRLCIEDFFCKPETSFAARYVKYIYASLVEYGSSGQDPLSWIIDNERTIRSTVFFIAVSKAHSD